MKRALQLRWGKNARGVKTPIKENIAVKPEIFLKPLFSLLSSKDYDEWTQGLIISDVCGNIQGLCGLEGWKTEDLWATLSSDRSKSSNLYKAY